MGDEPLGNVTHAELRELDALRSRAYGPDDDIWDDAVAVSRLLELEERVRLQRFPTRAEPLSVLSHRAVPGTVPDSPAERPSTFPGTATMAAVSVAPTRRPPPRWHAGIIAGTAVVAALLGTAAWSESRAGDEVAARYAKTAAVALERRALSYEADYELYLDGLREELLSAPGMQDIAARLIREQLRPYGTLYGRTVGAGPTVDHEFCMIVADLPAPSITCISIENAYANPVSIILPAWYSDSESDVFVGLGEPVSYTLLPGGGVVAELAEVGAAPAS